MLTPHWQVLSIIKRLNIQIDNLCQFLPQVRSSMPAFNTPNMNQDKVPSFAKMNAVELLAATQEAVKINGDISILTSSSDLRLAMVLC